MANVGDRGKFAGPSGEIEVEVVKVHDDGKLDLQGTGPNVGKKSDMSTPSTNPNPAWFERIDPSLFTTPGPVDVPGDEGVTEDEDTAPLPEAGDVEPVTGNEV